MHTCFEAAEAENHSPETNALVEVKAPNTETFRFSLRKRA